MVAVGVGVHAAAMRVRVVGHALPPHFAGVMTFTLIVYATPQRGGFGEVLSVY
jgi:hypothetical protein